MFPYDEFAELCACEAPIVPPYFGRDQVLTWLWELVNLSHEVTRDTIAGQIKALSMIVAIEALIPGRPSPSATQSTAPPVEAQIYQSEGLRKQQHQTAGPQVANNEPGDAVVPPEAKPAPTRSPTRSMLSPLRPLNPTTALPTPSSFPKGE
jgi:hypothetical protein